MRTVSVFKIVKKKGGGVIFSVSTFSGGGISSFKALNLLKAYVS